MELPLPSLQVIAKQLNRTSRELLRGGEDTIGIGATTGYKENALRGGILALQFKVGESQLRVLIACA